MSVEGERSAEILDAAATLFGSRGVRTSLQQVAEACGILPGSLYHHFDSKDAIYIALVERYRAELDRVADAAIGDPVSTSRPPIERIVALGTAIAECAVRHRAALLLTYYDPPPGSSVELVSLASTTAATARAAMTEIVVGAQRSGFLRPDVDAPLLAERICQSMLNVGIGVYHRTRGAERVPATKCLVLLHGVARDQVKDDELDGSAAQRAADAAIATWDDDPGDVASTSGKIMAAARSEFARRGYQVTTVRDIAAAAGLSAGGVYRHIESKDELYWSIMQRYSTRIADGWDRIEASSSTPLEQLDGLLWLMANTADRFAPEHRMVMVGLRYSPPTSPNLKFTFQTQLRQLSTLLVTGVQVGELRIEGSSIDVWARCIFDLISMPETVLQRVGLHGALRFCRETILRGAARRD